MTIGERLKFYREQKKYTLKELSELSSLSAGFLSQVERDRTEPSIASLKRLCIALEIKLKDLFDDELQTFDIVKKGHGAIRRFSPTVYYELLVKSDDLFMEPTLMHMGPHTKSEEMPAHNAEEFVWIAKGRLKIILGDECYALEEGDSLYFPATVPHSWKNEYDESCEAIWIISPPSGI